MSEQDDLNELLNDAVDVATELLAASSEFLPFALAMQMDGEVFHIEPDEEDGDSSDPTQIMAALKSGLRDAARQGRWRAVGIVSDVTIEDEDGETISAAIHIAMEHLGAEPVTCTIPYAIENDEVVLDELIAEPGENEIFQKRIVN